MRSSFTRIVSTLLVLFFMAACGSSSDESVAENDSNYYLASKGTNWSKEGNYKAIFSFDDETNVSFKDGVAKSDFKLYYAKELNSTVMEEDADKNSSTTTVEIEPIYINDFDLNITDKTIQLSFTNPINSDTNTSTSTLFVLESDKNVTTDDKYSVNYFNIEPIDYNISSITSTGFNDATTTRSVKLTLQDGQKFASILDKSMFTLDIANITTTVTRQSDNEVLLDFDAMPEILETSSIMLTISQNAFEYNFFGDKNIFINSSNPQAWVDQYKTNFENSQLTISIYYSSDYEGVENGVSIDGINIISQSFKDNNYTITLSGENSLDEYIEKLEDLNASVKLKTKNANQIDISVPLNIVKPYITANLVSEPSEKHKIEVDIYPVYGTFADTLEFSDFDITRVDGKELENLKLVSKDEDKLTFSFDTPDEILELNITLTDKSKFISTLAPNTPINTIYGVSAYDIEAYKGAQEAAIGILKFGAGMAWQFAAPYVLEELGLQNDHMRIMEIQDGIKNINKKIDNMYTDMNKNFQNLSKYLKSEFNDGRVNNFNSVLNNVSSETMTMLSNNDILNYLIVMTEESNSTEAQKDEAKAKFVTAMEKNFTTTNNIDIYANKVRAIGLSIENNIAYKPFFYAINHSYNFASQTIKGKKAFLDKVYFKYFINAILLHDYYLIKNNHNADEFKNQMQTVNTRHKLYVAKLEYIEKLDKNKQDIILVKNSLNGTDISKYENNAVVGKDMVRMKLRKGDYGSLGFLGYFYIGDRYLEDKIDGNWENDINELNMVKNINDFSKLINLNTEDCKEMNNRAKARGKNSMLEDIWDAGFNYLPKNAKKWYFANMYLSHIDARKSKNKNLIASMVSDLNEVFNFFEKSRTFRDDLDYMDMSYIDNSNYSLTLKKNKLMRREVGIHVKTGLLGWGKGRTEYKTYIYYTPGDNVYYFKKP